MYTYYSAYLYGAYKGIIKHKGIDTNAELFTCRLGVIAISDDGTIMWCRDGGILNDELYLQKKQKLSELVPINNFF